MLFLPLLQFKNWYRGKFKLSGTSKYYFNIKWITVILMKQTHSLPFW